MRMGRKQSSFHMGDEFNGNAAVRYLKGTQPCIHPPVSQENVQLTPDFGSYLLKVLGCIPVVISPLNANPVLLALLGSMASVNQVFITKDPVTGNYIFKFNIISPQDFTDGSYLYTFQIMDNQVPTAMGVADQWVPVGSQWKYFKDGSYLTHTWHKINGLWYYFHSDGIMASHEWIENGGKWYFVHGAGDMAVGQWVKTNDKWYYVEKDGVMVSDERKKINDIWYFFHEEGDMAVDEIVDDVKSGNTYQADKNGELEEVIKINDWLIGHKKPSKQGGRTVKAANLPNIFTDWYAYENQSDLGHYVKIEFPSLKAKSGSYGELLDENNNYWIAVGPRVYNSKYSDYGDLKPGGKGDRRLEMGKYADVVIQCDGEPKIYLYCRLGDVKAHTWIDYGKKENGLSQTGKPYPNNSSGEAADLSSANGNSVEFMGMGGNNGSMSKYKLVKIAVFD